MGEQSSPKIGQSLIWGTILAIIGILSALIEQHLGFIASEIASSLGILPPPFVVFWASASLGIIVGDFVTKILVRNVATGVLAGIKKGLIAGFIGSVGFFLSNTPIGRQLIRELTSFLSIQSPTSTVVMIITISLGTILGDYLIEAS